MTYKVLKTKEPKYLSDLLKPYTSNTEMSLRTSSDVYRLDEPRALNERSFFERSFSYSAPRLYNKLPSSLKECDSTDIFKSKLKTYFFEKSYDVSRLSITEDYCL